MGVPVTAAMIEALPPMNLECRAAGLPVRLLASAVVRARSAALDRARAPAAAAPEPAPPADTAVPDATAPDTATPDTAALDRTLRGFTLADLCLEASRQARAAAAEAEDLEGLAAGRTYGDRTLHAILIPPASYRAAAAEARRRAEMAGATADFLRGLLGGEAPLAAILAERRP